MAETKTPGWWLDVIHKSVGKFISLETWDGVIREGRLSGLRLKTLLFDDQKVDTIEELEMNGDPTDCVELTRVKRINIQQP